MTRAISFIPAAAFLVLWLLGVAPTRAQDLPDGPGKETFVRVCSACHGVEWATSTRRNKGGWEDVVALMTDRGLDLSEGEREAIVNYLARNFGITSADKVNVNTATAEEMESRLRLTSKEADAIVKYRQQHGNFKDWNDLLKVDGVNAMKIEAARAMDLITV